MKFKVDKNLSREQIVDVFNAMLIDFESRGATQFKSTFYVNFYNDENRLLTLTNDDRISFDGIKGGINTREAVQALTAQFNNHNYRLELAAEVKKEREKIIEELDRQEAIRRAAVEERWRLEREENARKAKRIRDIEDNFRNFILSKHGIKPEEKERVNSLLSSVGINDNISYILRKWLNHDESLLPEEGWVLRASYKNFYGKVRRVEIYNPQHELIVAIDK
jgi:vacuolar-type H+-ATPase subunit I/STV1